MTRPIKSFSRCLKARALLAEAGYPDGFSMDIWAMPVQRLYNPNALKMAELMQADLAQIGVRANIVSYEWNSFRRKLGSKEIVNPCSRACCLRGSTSAM